MAGGIPLSAKFDNSIAEPLDSKIESVSTFSELSNTPFPYKGTQKLVEDEGDNGAIYVLGTDLVTWAKASNSDILIEQLTDSSTYVGQNILPALPASDGATNTFVAGNSIGNDTYNEIDESVVVGHNIGSGTSDYFLSSNSVIVGGGIGLDGKAKISYSNIIGQDILSNFPKIDSYQYVNNIMGYGVMKDVLIPNGETDTSYISFSSFIGNRGLASATLKNANITSVACLGESTLNRSVIEDSNITGTVLVGNNVLYAATFDNLTLNKSVILGGNGFNSTWTGGKAEFNSILGVGNLENQPIDGTGSEGFSFNCIVGTANLTNGTVGASGQRNTIIGAFNAGLLESGNRNNIIGYTNGLNLTTGSDNTLIGSYADVASGSISNAVVIGSFNATESNSSTLASTGKIFLAPNSSNGTSSTVFELPDALGSAGDTLVDTLGNGVISWQSPFDNTVKAPTSVGVVGQKSYNSGFKYTCVATDTWVREAVDTSW